MSFSRNIRLISICIYCWEYIVINKQHTVLILVLSESIEISLLRRRIHLIMSLLHLITAYYVIRVHTRKLNIERIWKFVHRQTWQEVFRKVSHFLPNLTFFHVFCWLLSMNKLLFKHNFVKLVFLMQILICAGCDGNECENQLLPFSDFLQGKGAMSQVLVSTKLN